MTARPDRIEWGFSSLGCAELDMKQLGDLAREFGLDFLELRAVKGNLRLPDYFHATPSELTAAGVPVRVLSTSLRLTAATEDDIQEFLHFGRLANHIKAPYIRIFGGEEWGTEITPELLVRAAKTATRCREVLKEQNSAAELLLETHSGFSSGKICRLLNEKLAEPLAILWDSHHTWKLAGESLEQTWQELGPWVRHIHLKDSVLDPAHKAGYQYVPPGQGRFPTNDLLALLKRVGYRGGVSLEWERLWRPELPEIRLALQGLRKVASAA